MRRIVLVGGGHAHVHLLKVAADHPPEDTELVLVSPSHHHHYSGMVPGYLAGHYAEPQLAFDLDALARAAGARLVTAWATGLSMARRELETDAGVLAFDRISLDIGSVPRGLELPGVADHAASVRPMSRAVALRARLDALLESAASMETHPRPSDPLPLTVVGGGAAGLEVALALHRRTLDAGRRSRITLVEGGPTLLPDFSPRVRRRATGLLHQAGIELRIGSRAAAVTPDALRLDDGDTLPSRLTVWLAGAAPPPLLAASDLPLSPDGFFQVDAELRAAAATSAGRRPPAWGAGDCIALEGAPWMPRAGVYAVRQAPVLAHNVLACDAERYVPQRSFLALMNTADGRALLRWKGFVTHARWAWWLKDRIDRSFMARYGG